MRCMVCQFSIAHRQNNTAICQACRKFYYRVRQKLTKSESKTAGDSASKAFTLRCLSRTNRCAIGDANATAIGTGVMWRMICPKCRFDKCIAMGVEQLCTRLTPNGNLSSASTLSPDDSLQTSPVDSNNSSQMQQPPNQIAAAIADFSSALQELSANFHFDSFQSITEAWCFVVKNFEHAAIALSTFLKQLPGFSLLQLHERRLLFSKLIAPALFILTKSLPATFHHNIMAFFPELEVVSAYSARLSSAVASWNLSPPELDSLLPVLYQQALAELNDVNSGIQHSSPSVTNALSMIDAAVDSLLASTSPFYSPEQFTAYTKAIAEINQVVIHALCRLQTRLPFLFSSNSAATSPLFDDYIATCCQLAQQA